MFNELRETAGDPRCRSPEPLSKAGAQRVLHLLMAAQGRSGTGRPAERSD